MATVGATGRPAGIDGPYAWARLAVSVLVATIGGAGMWSIVVVLPAMQVEFGIDRAHASLPYTATMLGFAMGNVVVGRAIDAYGYWRPAFIATLMLGAGFLLASVSTGALYLTLVQGLLIGAGSSATFGPLIADISHWFVRRRGVAVAAAASGNYLAGAVWPLVIPPLMQAGDWRFAYWTIGLICLATMLPLLLLLRRAAPAAAYAPRSDGRGARPVGLSPAALQTLLIVAGFACCMAMAMPQVHLVAYCADLGYGVARGAEMLSLMLLAGVISRMASGFVADRIGAVPTLLIGSVGQGLALLLYVPFDELASLYVVSAVFGLAQGGIVPCYALIVRETMPAREAGRRVGLVIMATIVGMAAGGWMSGWIYDLTGSYAAAFLNGIGWNLLNIVVITALLIGTRLANGATRPA
jgi:MFS family permease